MLNRATKQRHALHDRKDDLYETVPQAVHALLRHEVLPKILWEPACGRGAISNILRAKGHWVYCTDLVNYGSGHTPNIDFLLETKPWNGDTQCIITNPPFKLADEFARHALTLCPKVVMLLRLAFLEGTKRSDILDNGTLARVYVFRNRLPMMHREGWDGPRATSQQAYAWFVWDMCQEPGPATINRISWE